MKSVKMIDRKNCYTVEEMSRYDNMSRYDAFDNTDIVKYDIIDKISECMLFTLGYFFK